MPLSALSAAQAGLTAASTALDVGAHNVANVLTDGFTPQQATFRDDAAGGVKVSISAAASQGPQNATQPSGTDLVRETGARISGEAAYRANLKVLQTADDISGVIVHLADDARR